MVMCIANSGMILRSGGMSAALAGGGKREMGSHWRFMCRLQMGVDLVWVYPPEQEVRVWRQSHVSSPCAQAFGEVFEGIRLMIAAILLL